MRTAQKQPRMMRTMIALREIFHSPEAMLRIDRCDAGWNYEGCYVGCKGLGPMYTPDTIDEICDKNNRRIEFGLVCLCDGLTR